MAITIDWATKIINIPKADMALIQSSPEIRELNLHTFRLALKDLEDDEAGMPYPKTHIYKPTVTIGKVTLARTVEISSPYTITFENGVYAVDLVGANSNISDVMNLNAVSLRPANSARLSRNEAITGTITSNGLDTTVFLISDEYGNYD